MKWRETDHSTVVDEYGRMVCVFSDEANEETKSLVLRAPRMLEAIHQYVEQIENGGYAGKKVYNNFKNLLERIYEE